MLIRRDNYDGSTPLHIAARFGHGIQAVVALLTDYEQRTHEAQQRASIIARTIAMAIHPRLLTKAQWPCSINFY